jgi:ABC-type bacteriocin/lantibiotic exporter with double-glycine peptidase domain
MGTLSSIAVAVTPLLGTVLLTVLMLTSSTRGGALLMFIYLYVRFTQNVAGTVHAHSNVNMLWPQLADCARFHESFSSEQRRLALSGVQRAPAVGRVDMSRPPPPSVIVTDVCFGYSGRQAQLIRRLSFSIAGGGQLGIVGPSGCGKSTLLALLLGLMPPTEGTIHINNLPPQDFFRDRSNRVGYVGADAFLIEGSLRANLVYGHPAPESVTDEDCWLALKRVLLGDLVAGLPGGLSYAVAEDGSGLSAGQQQRLCLARALLGDPLVLILDEATANLDSETEHEIANCLKSLKGRCTTIIVSHRDGVLIHSDARLELAAPLMVDKLSHAAPTSEGWPPTSIA